MRFIGINSALGSWHLKRGQFEATILRHTREVYFEGQGAGIEMKSHRVDRWSWHAWDATRPTPVGALGLGYAHSRASARRKALRWIRTQIKNRRSAREARKRGEARVT